KRELPLFILLSENTGEEWRQVRQLICLSPRLSDHWETCSQMNEDLLYSLIFFDTEARSGTSDQAKAPLEFPPSTLIQNADSAGTESTNQIPPILLSHLLKKFSDNLNENLWENALKIYSEDILPILQKNPSLKRAANLIVNFLFASPVPPNGKNRYLEQFLESLLTLDTSDEVYATIIKHFIYQYESQYLSQVTNKENLLVDSGTFYQIAIQMAERGSTVVGKILFLWLTFTPIPWNLIENVYSIMGRTCVEETKKAALPNATAYSSIWLPLHLETLFSRIKSENDVSMRLFYDLLSVILPNTPVLEDSMFACIFDKVEIKPEQIPYLYRIGKLFYPSLVNRMSLIRRLRIAMGLTDPSKDPLLLLGLASLCSEYPGISFSIEETNKILRAV
ncbi:MAG: hypothetical protein KDK40_04545, partial [Chlamydiia bacterium]|nr:hypothetical protein [Chlamydiia bacterium]